MGDLRENPLPPIDWTTVMRDYYPAASRVIDRLMPRSLRTRYDPEDFVGDAIVELMAKPDLSVARGPALLIVIARRRMIDAARSPQSRMLSLDIDLMDHRPAVDLQHDASERRALLLDRVGNPKYRAVVDLRCQGHTLPEIADVIGVRLRTVQRFFKRFTNANRPS